MGKNSVESEGAFGRFPVDIEVQQRPRRPMQGSVAGASIVSHGSVAVFGRAIRHTLDEIIQDEVIVRKGNRGAPGSKIFVTNRSAATQALPIKVLELILWLLLGSVFKARLEHLTEACWHKILFSKFTLGMSRKITKKKCLHRECCVRAKAKVKKFGVEHYQLLWLYAAGADQVTNHLRACIRSLHLQSLCVGNGRRERLFGLRHF
jgi:hypothetical protein